ncbi:NADH-quinone oxidoreductase subunit M [Calidifontibacter sp. DB0510]|uniref:NADH-quinone oxidoreductase subunit M n=1 Tax=Metallococcus carri TaxID=1656884 RepID=A0A967B0M3_9MICO|nr:NADH-quinone oxidoreductase subunit M [Metallococcus carri]NHN55235.1 NADH-quinone oxidoreductase subunit M [Metallococcus carri]NOP36312.1 NADH-quinone oxidoreductase subunit M [Calidifontibacter sp. DB2511S]
MVAALWVAGVLPLLTAAVLLALSRLPRRVPETAVFVISLASAAISLVAAVLVVWRRPSVDLPWVPGLGLRWQLGVDGISGPLLVLAAAVTVLAVLQVRTEPTKGGSPALHQACLAAVQGGAALTFLARDAVLFFVAFEIVLIPMWVLIAVFGDRSEPGRAKAAATTFVLYTVAGSTIMLTGIVGLVYAGGTADLARLSGSGIPAGQQTLLAAVLLLGLAVKVPLWPLHSWLPAAHTTAPTSGSMVLAAVLLKMGTYGVVRLVVGPLHEGFARLAPIVGTLAVIGILWAGLICLVERSLKRVIAYSSVAHMGVVMLALASGSALGLQAALYGNLAHGVISALLFAVVGGLKHRWHGDDLQLARPGARDLSPRLGLALVLGLAASLGVPALAGFWAEFLTVVAAWSPADGRSVGYFRVLAALAALGAVLGAAYALRVARLVWAGSDTGDAREPVAKWPDLHAAEWVVVSTLALAVVVLGVWPNGLMQLAAPVVRDLLGVAR